MGNLVKQEIYKLVKRPTLTYFWGFLLVFQIAAAVYVSHNPQVVNPQKAFLGNFFVPAMIAFFMISLCSTTLSTEIQSGTLKSLLYRKYSVYQVLISKWLSLLIYTITLYVAGMIISLVLHWMMFQKTIPLSVQLPGGHSFLQVWALTSLGSFLSLIFLLTFVLLIGTLFTSSTAALVAGIATYFITSIFNQLLFQFIIQHDWLKWTPFNMMNIGDQIMTPSMSEVTHLSLFEMSAGYLVYAVLFLGAGLIIFRRRNTR
ncbi:ABC transporter permease [Lacticaseibacillus brantae]|uniref:ABC transporter permease n=1 Tax=Lacticaseibacillus brantae TaxID=943673 RepID=UPI000709C351|nr:ABC transporter permease subunit [Lacticaseibacillus brantae]